MPSCPRPWDSIPSTREKKEGGKRKEKRRKKRRRRKRRRRKRRRKAFAVKLDQCLFLFQHTCILNWFGMIGISNF